MFKRGEYYKPLWVTRKHSALDPWLRERLACLNPAERAFLFSGQWLRSEDPEGRAACPWSESETRATWRAFSEELVRECRRDFPGRRPWGFWQFGDGATWQADLLGAGLELDQGDGNGATPSLEDGMAWLLFTGGLRDSECRALKAIREDSPKARGVVAFDRARQRLGAPGRRGGIRRTRSASS